VAQAQPDKATLAATVYQEYQDHNVLEAEVVVQGKRVVHGTSTTAKAATAYKAVSTALIFIMLVVGVLADTKVQLQAMEA
jgi:hypothetical protein